MFTGNSRNRLFHEKLTESTEVKNLDFLVFDPNT